MEGLPSADKSESGNGTSPAWYDSWNDLGNLNAEASQMSLNNDSFASFSPHPPHPANTYASGSRVLSPSGLADCSSSETQEHDMQCPHSSYPYSAAFHGAGLASSPCQPINAMGSASLYHPPDADTCLTACSAQDAAQSPSPPPAGPKSSFSSPLNRAAHPFNPAVPNFSSDTFSAYQLEGSRNSDIIKAHPLRAGSFATSSSNDFDPPPPAKKARTRTSQSGKTAGSSKSKKMSSQQPPERGSSQGSAPPDAHPPPPQDDTGMTAEDEQARVRQWHNCIGKKYRNKLNDEFESLQAVLGKGEETVPTGRESEAAEQGKEREQDVDAEGETEDRVEGPGRSKRRQLNKAKVLDMAKERIEALTLEREALIREKEELRARGAQVRTGDVG
ncbi:hypothetical protein B0T16DRAFT_494982 [Cercophora newfieldiana]|uniref:BHLH domain-containing protein n=1 Tax=Cercophora newfieldiana TaxID=92897 RepID=A0AA39Y152_9PEZI|nr:hypothetical protein B0T16DRAFT_494982 [Cercophora newfieldiana]